MRFFLLLAITFSLSVFGAELQIPALTSPIMDGAGLLTPQQKTSLGQLAYEIYAHKGPQMTIFTVKNLQGYPIEEFSIQVAEKWQLGTKKEGNGILIIIAKEERTMRFEVGEGIEGEITDFEANQYIRTVLTPHFKQGDFFGGLQIVMLDIARKFGISLEGGQKFVRRSTPAVKLDGPLAAALPVLLLVLIIGQIILRKKPLGRGIFTGAGLAGTGFFVATGVNFAALIVLFLLGLFIGIVGLHNILFALAASRGMGHHRGRLGGGGGSWGGGGGGFSGGGSSGSW